MGRNLKPKQNPEIQRTSREIGGKKVGTLREPGKQLNRQQMGLEIINCFFFYVPTHHLTPVPIFFLKKNIENFTN